mmetsp:Transcript_1565/g.3571  ORF Transcript_1565/g.3571 Transcript_1565/m.3571 type:complete len:114 (+) Transcript_1565:527-868(+)
MARWRHHHLTTPPPMFRASIHAERCHCARCGSVWLVLLFVVCIRADPVFEMDGSSTFVSLGYLGCLNSDIDDGFVRLHHRRSGGEVGCGCGAGNIMNHVLNHVLNHESYYSHV